MKATVRPILLMFILFLVVSPGHSTMLVVQKEISLSRSLTGHAVVRGTNMSATGVKVELCDANWRTVLASTTTDEKGYFSLEKAATGNFFYLRLSAPGMDIYELRVRIEKHATRDLTIQLSVAT
jgi:hypothetical protein